MTRLVNRGADLTRIQRNLNPHKPAIAAMWLWGKRYSQQGGGSMDFWDSLTPREKGLARELVTAIANARGEVRGSA